jgi:hypothetical protein
MGLLLIIITYYYIINININININVNVNSYSYTYLYNKSNQNPFKKNSFIYSIEILQTLNDMIHQTIHHHQVQIK